MVRELRFCVFDDQEVREVGKADPETTKVWGRGKEVPKNAFYHIPASVPSCGRQFLAEDQTYTEGESDLNPPSAEF